MTQIEISPSAHREIRRLAKNDNTTNEVVVNYLVYRFMTGSNISLKDYASQF